MTNELKIQASANVQRACNNLKTLQNTLVGTGNIVTRVGKIFDKEGNAISTSMTQVEQKGNKLYRTIQRIDANGTLRGLSQSVSDVKVKTDGTANSFAKLKNILNVGATIGIVKKLTGSMLELTTKSVDYSESLNLFNTAFNNVEKDGETAFSEVGRQATEFQEKLQRNFGANRTESMYYQGVYQSLANAQGIVDKYAQIMSENSTKLTYDLSSLFNQNQDNTAKALRAGIYAGETEPLRNYGIDLTENTLQRTLDKLKETNNALNDLNVSTMSQAEKQILRYISVLNQASIAHGDFANTIDSPANQLKIFHNQVTEMGVAVGNLFIGPLQKLLTFANAVVIVVKQVAQALGSLFGIKVKDYNSGIIKATDVSSDLADSYDGVGSSAGKAGKKIKELTRQALAFDNINNINETKDTAGGSSGGGSSLGGINQALLDSLNGYDNGLDKVKLKAQEIADRIMKWLGFTYDAEEGVWKLSKAYDKLISSCKNLNKAFDVLGGYTFENLTNFYKNFLKPVGSWTLGTGLPKFVDITANGIMKTDWANLNDKLNGFYKSLTPFSINIGEGLLWFYEKVLIPIGSFTIGKVVPEFIDLLSSGLDILNNTIDVMKPGVKFLWDNFLSPISKWTGGVAVDVLKDINSVFKLISKSKVASTVTSLGVAFLLVKKNGGLANTVLKLLPTPLKLIFVNAEKTAEILGDKKATGLSKVILGLKSNVASLISPLKDLKFALNEVNHSGKSTFQGLAEGINLWSQTSTKLDKFKTTLIGIGGTVLSLKGVSNAMKDITESGLNAGNGLTLFGSSLGTTASMALMGAQHFGAYGAAVGGIVGLMVSLNTAISAIPDKYDKIAKAIDENCEKSNKYINSIKEQREAIEKSLKSETDNIGIHKQLYTELQTIVDVNGKIKSGYEDRAKFIVSELNRAYGTEYKVVDGVIQKYEELTTTVQELINKKTAEIVLQHKEQEYYNALKEKAGIESTLLENRKNLTVAQENLNKAEKEYQFALETNTAVTTAGRMAINEAKNKVSQMTEEVNKASEAYNHSANEYKEAVTSISGYQDLLVAISDNNYAEMNRIVDEWGENNYRIFAETLTKQTNELNGGDLSKGLKEAWKILAQNDYETYANTISQMPEETRKNIQKITGVVIEKTPEVEKTSDELGKKMIKKMKKDKEASETGTEIIKQYIKGLSKNEQKQLLEDCGVKNVDSVIKGLKKKNHLSEEVGIQVVQGLKKGLDNNYWQGQTLSTAATFASSILNKWKKIFDIHSPSHATEFFSIQLLKGYNVGFNKEQDNVLTNAEKFSKSLVNKMSLNTADMKSSLNINTNKIVDYSEIRGAIKTSTNCNFDNGFINKLGVVIANCINDRPIDINVNTHTEKGTIVETAIEGINRVTDTTGECPIRVI